MQLMVVACVPDPPIISKRSWHGIARARQSVNRVLNGGTFSTYPNGPGNSRVYIASLLVIVAAQTVYF